MAGREVCVPARHGDVLMPCPFLEWCADRLGRSSQGRLRSFCNGKETTNQMSKSAGFSTTTIHTTASSMGEKEPNQASQDIET